MSKQITHIIYDMDGLLLDTEILYTKITNAILEPFGITLDWDVKSQMLGKRAIESATILVNAYKIDLTPQQYNKKKYALMRSVFPEAKIKVGAYELTEHLAKNNIPQSIATSSSKVAFDLKTKAHKKWLKTFDFIVKGDDKKVKNSKPAPDIFLVAADLMKARPEQCLVFEDAPAGVEAALSANMSVIAIPDDNLDKNMVKSAAIILESLTQFNPAKWGLPAY